MAIPSRKDLLLPILQTLSDGLNYSTASALDVVATNLKLTAEDVTTLAKNGKKAAIKYEFNWAIAYLKRAGVIEAIKVGVFHITDAGRALLSENPATLDTSILRRYPEFAKWTKNRDRKTSSIVDASVHQAQTIAE